MDVERASVCWQPNLVVRQIEALMQAARVIASMRLECIRITVHCKDDVVSCKCGTSRESAASTEKIDDCQPPIPRGRKLRIATCQHSEQGLLAHAAL